MASALLALAAPAFALRSPLATAVDDPTPTAVAHTVRSGECLIGILAAHGVAQEELDDWHRAAQPVADLGRLLPGRFRVICERRTARDGRPLKPGHVLAVDPMHLSVVDARAFKRLRANVLTRLAAIPRATTAATAADIGLPPLAQAARVGPITLTF